MKFYNVILVAASLFTTVSAQARDTPFLTCTELGGSTRHLAVNWSTDGVSAVLDGRSDAIEGSIDHRVVSFLVADWQDANFLSLELKEVNGRYIGVLYTPTVRGPGAYDEAIFKCAEKVPGSASSNGG